MRFTKALFLGVMLGGSIHVGATTTTGDAVMMNFSLKINGQKAQPTIIATYGREATLTQSDDTGEGYEISVLPTRMESKSDQTKLLLALKISEITHGAKEVVGQPRMIVLDGNTASVSHKSKEGKTFEIQVTPTTKFKMPQTSP